MTGLELMGIFLCVILLCLVLCWIIYITVGASYSFDNDTQVRLMREDIIQIRQQLREQTQKKTK